MNPRDPVRELSALPCTVVFFGGLLFLGAEIAAFVAVAGQLGFFLTLAMLIGISALGPFVVRRVGFGVLVHTKERLAKGEVPTRELFDGLVVLAGGVLICVPGFVGDAFGLLLMIGPVRHLVIRVAGRGIARRVQALRTNRWQVIDAQGQPTRRDDPHGRPSLSPRQLGIGEHVRR